MIRQNASHYFQITRKGIPSSTYRYFVKRFGLKNPNCSKVYDNYLILSDETQAHLHLNEMKKKKQKKKNAAENVSNSQTTK